MDESTGRRFNELLKLAGFDSLFAGDILQGLSDELILAKADREGRILITDDKDFGELIFRLNRPSMGVVLLRTSTTDPKQRIRVILDVIKTLNLEHKFTTVTEDRIRTRRMP
ncbi:MAG: DUF5615 family PIN-like protein [Nitrososphaerales archaeon]